MVNAKKLRFTLASCACQEDIIECIGNFRFVRTTSVITALDTSWPAGHERPCYPCNDFEKASLNQLISYTISTNLSSGTRPCILNNYGVEGVQAVCRFLEVADVFKLRNWNRWKVQAQGTGLSELSPTFRTVGLQQLLFGTIECIKNRRNSI